MAKNICRLCFDEKTNSIGIFTTKGFLLGIASAIRMHILDEVNKDDSLPKFVCTDCWTKLSDFNKFYNAVDEAKIIYMKRSVKEEQPSEAETNFETVGSTVETNYEASESVGGENASVKSEPMDFDVDFWKSESPPLEEDSFQIHDESEANIDDSDIRDWPIKENEFTPTTRKIAMSQDIDEKPANISLLSAIEPLTNNGAVISKSMKMTCERCGLPVKTLSELIKHNQNKHHERRILMRCCETKLNVNDLLDHMEYHKNPHKYRCKNCNKYFTLKKDLNPHIVECAHSTLAYSDFDRMLAKHLDMLCDLCGQSVKTLSGAIQHNWKIHQRGLSTVRCCNRRIELSELRDHMEYHVNPKKYECDHCNYTFALSDELKKHLKFHLAGKIVSKNKSIALPTLKVPIGLHKKTIKCPQCREILTDENALTKHIQTIHSDKEHACLVCGKDYITASRLKEHMVKHTGEYLYKCIYCPKVFKFSSGIHRHHKTYHYAEWSANRAIKLRRK